MLKICFLTLLECIKDNNSVFFLLSKKKLTVKQLDFAEQRSISIISMTLKMAEAD